MRRLRLKSAIPLGPYLLFGCWSVLLVLAALSWRFANGYVRAPRAAADQPGAMGWARRSRRHNRLRRDRRSVARHRSGQRDIGDVTRVDAHEIESGRPEGSFVTVRGQRIGTDGGGRSYRHWRRPEHAEAGEVVVPRQDHPGVGTGDCLLKSGSRSPIEREVRQQGRRGRQRGVMQDDERAAWMWRR